jgi:hypothetical protein
VPLGVPGNKPKLCVRPSGVAIPPELQRSEEAAPFFSLRTLFVVAVQWRQISKIWCVNHLFFLQLLKCCGKVVKYRTELRCLR